MDIVDPKMAWFPDSNWLKALEIRGSTAAAVAVACIAIFFMAEAGWFNLGALPDWAMLMVVVVAVFALALVGGNLAQWCIEEASKKRERRRQEEAEAKHRRVVLGYLDTLSEREREVLSSLVRRNQQSFSAEIHGSRVATLKQKGLVVMASGVFSALDWPYMIPNFVWEELQRRKDEFNTAGSDGSHPWRETDW